MENAILVEELKQAWRELSIEVTKNKRLKRELFDSTFSQTYALLQAHVAETVIDKAYAELVAEAYLFANAKDERLDSTCLAAFILTERMLHCCAFSVGEKAEITSIYVVEARKEVPLSFGDVGDSIAKLSRIFEDSYWNKINS